jgi:GntR family transcriptional repressor for pyruvate dehydrogenase complex
MKLNKTRIERRRITDQIIDHLLAMIANGTFNPGDKLPPEHVLMEQFGVGRSSLREAIGALSLIGVLKVRPGHGTHVASITDGFLSKPLRWSLLTFGRSKIHELIEARIALEHAIVGMAADRATDEDITEIERCQNELKAAKKSGRKAIQADLAFHTALAKASHNSVLMGFLSELRQPIKTWMEQKASIAWGYDMVVEQHDALVAAIQERNSERAQAALHEHLESLGERLATALLQRQPE